jgi:hypothetical protein
MYLCILDRDGEIRLHQNMQATPEAFLAAVAPYRDDLVVSVECIFTWYWLADLCADEGIDFVLGHALYMKAIHGGKAKNDKIDAHKIVLGGAFTLARPPAAMPRKTSFLGYAEEVQPASRLVDSGASECLRKSRQRRARTSPHTHRVACASLGRSDLPTWAYPSISS